MSRPGRLVLAAVATIAACLPAWNFGQREHLIVLWFLPYVFVSAAWLAGAPVPATVRWAAGVLLGLAVSLKPHYALAVLLIEAGIAVERRSLRGLVRPVLLSALAVGVGYVLLVVVAYPAFFTLRDPAGPCATTRPIARCRSRPHTWPMPSCWWRCWPSRADPAPPASRTRLFVLAALGAYAAFLVQLKGWPYHFLPAKTLVFAALAVGLPAGARAWLVTRVAAPRQRQVAALACGACVAGAVLLHLAAVGRCSIRRGRRG